MKQKRVVQTLTVKSILILFALLVVMSLILYIAAPVIYNQWSLYRFAYPFFAYPLPPETREVYRNADVGVLLGNGNHCDFVAERQLLTTLNEATIRDYYENVRFSPVQLYSPMPITWGSNAIGIPLSIRFEADSPNRVTLMLIDGPYFDSFRMRFPSQCH